jgi:predicted Zn-dependent peptidase
MRNVHLSLGLAALLASGAVWAQGTPPGAGTVVKGRAPVAKDVLKVRFPRPKSFTLSNGVAVYVLEDHRMPAVRVSLSVRAGDLYEPKAGVADLTAAMLTEGTRSRTYQQLAAETEGIGATLNASAGSDTAALSVSGLSESTDTLLSLLADVLQHPTFPQDRLERQQFQRNSQYAQQRANPAAATADVSAKVFYGGTPYGKPSPTPAEISAVTAADLKAFHEAFYVPNGAIIGVSGDVSVSELKSKLESALGGWKPGPKIAELPAADLKAKEATKIFLVDRPGSTQTVLQFGNLAVKRDDPDYLPLVVANRILGGGSANRLFQNIRERRGYTYGAYSSLSAGRWPGIWGASASVRTPVTEPAVQEFFNEFNRLQDEPVTAEELERAKRSIVGNFALTLESPQGVLSRFLELVRDGLPLDYWDTYPSRIQAVTAEDVQRVARKYLGKNRIQLIAVGERSQIEEGLKKFGPVEIVDVAQSGGGGVKRGRE